MDIDGSEVEAIKGAVTTLPRIPLICVECVNFEWNTSHKKNIHKILASKGYSKVTDECVLDTVNRAKLEDVLYQRNDLIR
jgi:hypothetical protein